MEWEMENFWALGFGSDSYILPCPAAVKAVKAVRRMSDLLLVTPSRQIFLLGPKWKFWTAWGCIGTTFESWGRRLRLLPRQLAHAIGIFESAALGFELIGYFNHSRRGVGGLCDCGSLLARYRKDAQCLEIH